MSTSLAPPLRPAFVAGIRRPALGLGRLVLRPEAGSTLGLLVVFTVFAWFGGANFLSAGGAASWLNVAAGLGIVALPVGLLMIAGHLDLSIGAIIPAASITTAIVSGYLGAPIPLGIAAALLLGLAVGFVNGFLVVRTRLPSFVVTLATLFAVAGLTLGGAILIAGSTSVSLKTEGFAKVMLGQFLAGRFQVTILWWLAAVLVAWLVLHHSRYGNWIFAIGADPESARACGVPIERLTIALYMASGAAAAFLGLSQAILYNSAQVSAGQSFIFNSIIAVVIGGVLLTGGFGSVLGIVVGTLTFAIVNQGIYFTGLNANWASLVIGVLLLLAVLTNNAFRKMALSYAPRGTGDRR